jgi:hypothetical protein
VAEQLAGFLAEAALEAEAVGNILGREANRAIPHGGYVDLDLMCVR